MFGIKSRLSRNVTFLAISLVVCVGVSISGRVWAEDLVISEDTVWGEGEYSYDNLTVSSGAELRVAGASTVTVSEDFLLTGQSTLICEGKNTDAMVDDQWIGEGVQVECGNLTIETGSQISADGQGYTGVFGGGGNGPGGGDSYWAHGKGASHGGLTYQSPPTYGTAWAPVDLGSGGGGRDTYELSQGGSGGGAIRLIVSGTLNLEGTISANGLGNEGSETGGGSGGSVWVTALVLEGTGSMTANGGPGTSNTAGQGAGGRIMVAYEDATAFSGLENVVALGAGDPLYNNGEDGTVGFLDTDDNHLYIVKKFEYADSSILTFDDLTVSDGGVLSLGEDCSVTVEGECLVEDASSLELGGGVTLTVNSEMNLLNESTLLVKGKNRETMVGDQWVGEGGTIEAQDVYIDETSTISSDSQGYTGGVNGDGNGPGGGIYGVDGGNIGGGGYGGMGGVLPGFSYVDEYVGGSVYGSADVPVDLGSGGAGEDRIGGSGGGAIHLIVPGTLTLDGVIRSNGGTTETNSFTYSTGGGSGGSIWAEIGYLEGAGRFQANGGEGDSGGEKGAGGRIAVYYEDSGDFFGFQISEAYGWLEAEAGSVAFIHERSEGGSDLLVPPRGAYDIPDGEFATFRSVHFNGGDLRLMEDATLEVEDDLLFNDSYFSYICGGGSLIVGGELSLLDVTSLRAMGKNIYATVDEQWQGEGIFIQTDHLYIDGTSSLSADGEGYPGFQYVEGGPMDGPGLGPEPGGLGNNGGYGGAGHGGAGGEAPGGGGAGGIYGDDEMPVALGSGGASFQMGYGINTRSAAGGGAIRLIAESITVDGEISARGFHHVSSWPGPDWGGGSGGSLWINANEVLGHGTISVDGAEGIHDYESMTSRGPGGGGGGRLALYGWNPLGLDRNQVSADGGTASVHLNDYNYTSYSVPSGENGSLYRPLEEEELAHGIFATGWALLDFDPEQTTSVLTATFEDDSSTILAEDMSPVGHFLVDTTAFPDGVVELEAIFTENSKKLERRFQRILRVTNEFIWVDEFIREDTIWAPGKIYLVENNLKISNNASLTIQPGVIIKFTPGTSLEINEGATVDAQGTLAQPIILTSLLDDTAGGDTNMDGSMTSPRAADWVSDPSILHRFTYNEYTDFRYTIMPHYGDILEEDVVWTNKFIHHLSNRVEPEDGTTFTLEPGTIVKMDDAASFWVSAGGNMVLNGTADEPVYITSIYDDSVGGDTNRDGTSTVPQRGNWRYITVDGSLQIDHARISYGGDVVGLVRMGDGGVANISNSILHHHENQAIDLEEGVNRVTLKSSIIAWNDVGVQATAGTVEIINCTLYGNGDGVVLNNGSANIINTLICQSEGIGLTLGGMSPVPGIIYSNVWGSGTDNFIGMRDPSGGNGNISANPYLRAPSRGDYRLLSGSPLIDAANGSFSSEFDIYNQPRVDIPEVPNTGIAMSDGKFADIGAVEYQTELQGDIDFAVTEIFLPGELQVGEVAQVQYEVSNLGSDPAQGPWNDELQFFRPLPEGGEETLPLIVNPVNGNLSGGESMLVSASFVVPGGTLLPYKARVTTNIYNEVLEHVDDKANNTMISDDVVQIVPTMLPHDEVVVGEMEPTTTELWFWTYMGFDAKPILLDFSCSDETLPVNIYARKRDLPSSTQFDWRSSPGATGSQSLYLTPPEEGYIYILVELPSSPVGNADFSIEIQVNDDVNLESVSPEFCDASGPSTLELHGVGFTPQTWVHLVSGDSTEYFLDVLSVESDQVLYARVDPSVIPVGSYSIRVTVHQMEFATSEDPLIIPLTSTLLDAVEVGDFGEGRLDVKLGNTPRVRPNRPFDIDVVYGNVGYSDIPVPLLILKGDGCKFSGEDDRYFFQDELVFVGQSTSASPHWLRPGQYETYSIRARSPKQLGTVNLTVQEARPTSNTPDYQALIEGFEIDPASTRGQLVMTGLPLVGGDDFAELEATVVAGPTEFEANRSGEVAVASMIAQAHLPAAAHSKSITSYRLHRDLMSPRKSPPPLGYVPPEETETYYGEEDARNWNIATAMAYHDDLSKISGAWLLNPFNISALPGSEELSTYYASDHLDHFINGDGSEKVYAEDSVLAQALAGDPKVKSFTTIGGGGNPTRLAKKYFNEVGLTLTPNDIVDLSDTLGLTAVEGGIGLSFTGWDGAYGIGKVDSIEMEIDAKAIRSTINGQDMITVYGTIRFSLRDTYQWGGAYEDGMFGNQNTDPNFWGWYLQHYGLAKPFDVVVDLGEVYFSYQFPLNSNVDSDWSAQRLIPDLPEDPNILAESEMNTVVSIDPNEKQSSGTGEQGYITDDEYIIYTILFENLESAQVPAQEVMVTDVLDEGLDLSTFELLDVTFGNQIVPIPAGVSSFETLAPAPEFDPYPVRVSATLDPQSRMVTWSLQSEDPLTRWLPSDPDAGFLPPNDETHRGEGAVRFRIKPVLPVASGAQWNNQATIIFDPQDGVNPPIDTNEVVNTLDILPPESEVIDLDATMNHTDIPLTFTADDALGSGVAFVDLYVSVDDGEAMRCQGGITGREETYYAEPGHSYAFYTVARDQVGNREGVPDQPDTITTVPPGRLRVSPVVVDFEILDVYADSGITLTVSLENISQETVNFTGGMVSLTGENAGEFQLNSLDLTSIGVGVTREISVTFSPESDGLKTAAIKVETDDPQIPILMIGLQGYGEIVGAIPVSPAETTLWMLQ